MGANDHNLLGQLYPIILYEKKIENKQFELIFINIEMES